MITCNGGKSLKCIYKRNATEKGLRLTECIYTGECRFKGDIKITDNKEEI